MSLLVSVLVIVRRRAAASAIAAARIRRKSAVISSASISLSPRPKRCGASRLSGLVATSPPAPADPRGRPWQPAQLSERPAADRDDLVDVADAVLDAGLLALGVRELSLEQLPAPPDRPEWIAGDDECGRVGSVHVTAAVSDLLS